MRLGLVAALWMLWAVWAQAPTGPPRAEAPKSDAPKTEAPKTEPPAERLRVTVRAPGRDLRATGHRVPGRLSPLDRAVLGSHEVTLEG